MSDVLIIEDDAAVQEAYKIKFAKVQISINAIDDGKAAIEYITKTTQDLPKVIMLDLMLSNASGFDILEVIKKTKDWDKIPVIILSNLAQASDVKRVMDMGAKEYLVKADVTIDRIIQKIQNYLKLENK